MKLAVIHYVFQIFILNKYIGDPSLVIHLENVGLKDCLLYEDIIVR